MAQNVAILIGVPNSGSASFDPLHACSQDVDEMEQLIRATKRFNKVEKLLDATLTEIQDKLNGFINPAEKVGEIFLYFTGHGHADNSEFYWVMKGFDLDNPRSTGMSQSVLYEILRSIDATNTIIIQDACFSGQAFFKGDRTDRLPPLTNLVQISSSAANTETPSGQTLSPFTDHFIEAASTAKSEGSVNYLEITQKLNDLLKQNNIEPHLGYQGTFKQIFCDDAKNLQSIRSKYEISDIAEVTSESEAEPHVPLITDESVLEDACRKMLKQGDIQTLIDTGISLIENNISKRIDITQYYELSSVKHSDYFHATNAKLLCKIYRSLPKWDDFVIAHHERQKVRRMRFNLGGIMDSLYEPEYNEVYNIVLNASLENVHQIYHLNPKFDVLRRRELEILYIPGIFHVYVLWRFNEQGLSDWDTFTEERKQENWSYKEISTTDAETNLTGIVGKFMTDSETATTNTIRNIKAL